MILSSVLCVIAHPDDELFVAGLLAHFVQNKVDVHLLCLTRGDNGAPGVPAISEDVNLAEIRTSELTASARVLGAKSLVFLPYIDFLGPNGELRMPVHDPQTLTAEIVQTINQTAAQIVISHGSNGEYGHPAHKGLHRLVLDAVRESDREFYSFQANFDGHSFPKCMNEQDKADLILDIGAYAQSHMLPMFKCHSTQVSWWAHLAAMELKRGVTLKETWQRNVFSHPVVSLKRFWPQISDASILNQWLIEHPCSTGDDADHADN